MTTPESGASRSNCLAAVAPEHHGDPRRRDDRGRGGGPDRPDVRQAAETVDSCAVRATFQPSPSALPQSHILRHRQRVRHEGRGGEKRQTRQIISKLPRNSFRWHTLFPLGGVQNSLPENGKLALGPFFVNSESMRTAEFDGSRFT